MDDGERNIYLRGTGLIMRYNHRVESVLVVHKVNTTRSCCIANKSSTVWNKHQSSQKRTVLTTQHPSK